ncbi:GspH/FimT family pseudopilin [Methylococcus sp. EFPC2]|uniref:GspH/FimT family pseudopilin n=1 Tax=Methylococcus sp. EFPC2 TaxID=2812648 RepID=UPI001967616B|nr:GspH/FimT family pseudopilin [Methylococcus sp. EFPC2]QSA96724.1 GspH/FimT family pseudopilin [Methylococcus sp. EFPC2]
MNKHPAYSGFTLIELMVTLAVAAIILSLGVPGFQEVIRNNRLTTRANDVVTALNLARSEAIKRGVQVTVCKSNTTASSPVCATSGSWAQGWLVFVDQNKPSGTNGTLDAGDEILRIFPPLSGATMTAGSHVDDWIAYLPNGFAQGSGGVVNDTFGLCMAPKAKNIVVSSTGRARVEAGTC